MLSEDFDVVKRAQLGDLHAFRTLVECHQNMTYNLCYRMLKHTEEAKDAAQETFLKVYRSLGRFRYESSFKTWICRIAVNECINRSRSQKGLSSYKLEEDKPLQIADSAPSPLELIEQKEVEAMIHKAIDSLPEQYKLAITLYHLNELSYEEIAEAMGIPMGTVKTYLFRARAILKDKLKSL